MRNMSGLGWTDRPAGMEGQTPLNGIFGENTALSGIFGENTGIFGENTGAK